MNGFMSMWSAWYSDDVRRLVESGPKYAIEAGTGAVPLALLVLFINMLTRRWLSAAQMAALWSVVLVRLLVPTPPASPFSLNNLLEGIHYSNSAPTHREIEVRTVYEAPADQTLGDAPIRPDGTTTPAASTTDGWFDLAVDMSALVWLAVAVGLIAVTLIGHWRFCRQVRRIPACRDERLLALWDECCRMASVRERLSIVIVEDIGQPAVVGLLRPELVLPPDAAMLSDAELKMVMLHELAHVCRWDLAVNWALLFVRAVHWWNPIYWLAASRLRSLREQACDAYVLRKTANPSSRDYSELLLKLALQVSEGRRWRILLPASLLGFFASYFRKREVRLRLKALRSVSHYHSRWRVAAGSLFTVVVALCGLTDAEPSSPQHNVPHVLPPSLDFTQARTPNEHPASEGPFQTVSYALDDIHSRMPQLKLDQVQFRHAVGTLIAHYLHSTRSQDERRGNAKPPAPGESTPGGSYQLDEGSLVLTTTASMHQQVADLLQVWDETTPAQICVECRMIASPHELASSIGVNWKTLGAEKTVQDVPLVEGHDAKGTVLRTSAQVVDHLPAFVVPLNEQQAAQLVKLTQNQSRANPMFAPKVTLFNGQQAEVASLVKRPYVSGLERREGEMFHPQVEIIDEGTKLKLRTTLQGEGRRIRLSGALELTSIEDVRAVSFPTPAGQRSIQVPRVRRCQIAVASEIEDGQSLLIGCLPGYERKEMFYILLRASRLVESSTVVSVK